ncbi:MAG: isocitrate/isopropylmalate dehydrogenase family protein, partial [Pseudomonadota bacterium]
NPLAAILSGAMMLDYLGDKAQDARLADAAKLIEDAIDAGFVANALRPMEFGGDMGTKAVTSEVLGRLQ